MAPDNGPVACALLVFGCGQRQLTPSTSTKLGIKELTIKSKRTRAPRQTFVFVDTNIFLDFYRDSNEATLSLLERLKPVRDCIISTYQVEMEFLKNRQRVMVESLGKLKAQPPASVPALFADSGTNASLRAVNRAASKKSEIIRKRIVNLLRAPKQNDVVYQNGSSTVARHFKAEY